jgi:hypothetical protein
MFDPEALPVPDLGLKCLRCGYPLASLPEHRCPECGAKFEMEDHIPPGDFALLVVNGDTVPASHEVCELLAQYHIPHLVGDARTDTALMSAGIGPPGGGNLKVPRDCYFEVIDLLRRRLLGQPLPPPPSKSNHCAEWTCASCGESNPGDFEICWNCQNERK